MTQEDVQLNAAPSVTTVNQTPATIKIVEELSINNGAARFRLRIIDRLSKSPTRGPIRDCHCRHPDGPSARENEEPGFVTLQTNVTFDTPRSNTRPPQIDRRNVENEVRGS